MILYYICFALHMRLSCVCFNLHMFLLTYAECNNFRALKFMFLLKMCALL